MRPSRGGKANEQSRIGRQSVSQQQGRIRDGHGHYLGVGRRPDTAGARQRNRPRPQGGRVLGWQRGRRIGHRHRPRALGRGTSTISHGRPPQVGESISVRLDPSPEGVHKVALAQPAAPRVPPQWVSRGQVLVVSHRWPRPRQASLPTGTFTPASAVRVPRPPIGCAPRAEASALLEWACSPCGSVAPARVGVCPRPCLSLCEAAISRPSGPPATLRPPHARRCRGRSAVEASLTVLPDRTRCPAATGCRCLRCRG